MYGDFEYRERRYAFGNHILTLRTRVAITQIELAQHIGVHRRSVQNWETGESYPKADTLQRMIAVFLQRGAFRAGHEREEAQRLWNEVAQDGRQSLAAFDDDWFNHCVHTLGPAQGGSIQPSQSERPHVPAAVQTYHTTTAHCFDGSAAITTAPIYSPDGILWRLWRWSPDGLRLAGSGDDGTVYIWDVVTGITVHRLDGYHSVVKAMAWNGDGTKVATCGYGAPSSIICVWDTRTGKPLQHIVGEAALIEAIIWSANETVLISGGADGTLRWWDVQRAACERVRNGHHRPVQALHLSADGTKLMSCGADSLIMVWDVHTGAYLQTLEYARPSDPLMVPV